MLKQFIIFYKGKCVAKLNFEGIGAAQTGNSCKTAEGRVFSYATEAVWQA